MYPKVVPIPGNIELVQNSGIQFIDFDVMLDWNIDDKHNILKILEKGKFYNKDNQLGFFAPNYPVSGNQIEFEDVNAEEGKSSVTDNECTIIKLSDSLKLFDGAWFPLPFFRDECSKDNLGPTNWVRARIVKVDDPVAISQYRKKHQESLNGADRKYESVVNKNSYNYDDSNNYQLAERETNATTDYSKYELKEGEEYYRVVLAFDTKTYDRDVDLNYFAPTSMDTENGRLFRLSYKDSKCINFVNAKAAEGREPWVDLWLKNIFSDLYKERIKNNINQVELNKKIENDKEHQAHYYNLLMFLGFIIDVKPVKFLPNSIKTATTGNSVIDVSLILDIGNARSCGILVEDDNSVTAADDSFKGVYPLVIRDLNAPERVYDQAFSSQIEFSPANFEYNNLSDNSGRVDAFSWPSLVRVGNEANNLAALKVGNEGMTGLVSPKRYLWSTDRLQNTRWDFNPYSYQIKSDGLKQKQREAAGRYRAHINSMGRYFASNGKAIFALTDEDYDRDNTKSLYSYNSTTTFMIVEILLHALTQMNSYALRNRSSYSTTPRRLKAIILTTPPCMAIEEKELYRSCVYQAIGILWKSLGFDKTSPSEFSYITASNMLNKIASGETLPQINPPMPEVHMDWDEAESGQVVYVYNESVKTFAGHSNTFIKYLRRPMVSQRIGEKLKDADGKELYSARIASLDIGGGTTDLVIKDYTFKKDVPYTSDDIVPVDIYKDGFKIAGDDVIHDIIKQCILPRLAVPFAKNNIPYKPIFDRLVGDSTTEDSSTAVLRTQFTQQILVKIAYRLMFHMEHLDPYAHSAIVMGTVADFIFGKEVNENLPHNVERPEPYKLPSKEVLDYVDMVIGETFDNFSIMNFKLKFDIAKINRTILEGSKFDICRVLNKLGEVLTTFDVDLLLLTGRSSKIPAIRSFFLQRLSLPSSRIVSMHDYRCESWYPFLQGGEVIGDPKTTAAVGALISYLRFNHNKFTNFRFKSMPSLKGNRARFVGILDNKSHISEEAVLYTYESAESQAHKTSKDVENYDAKFKRYQGKDDAFQAPLALDLGYRLLDDTDFEASPLYIIEAYNSVDDNKEIKKAINLRYDSIDRKEVLGLIDSLSLNAERKKVIKEEALKLLNELESGTQDNLDNFKAYLENEFNSKIQAQVSAEMGPVPTLENTQVEEVKKWGFKVDQEATQAARQAEYEKQVAQYHEAYQARCQALFNQNYQQCVEEPYAQHEQNAGNADSKLYDLLDNSIDENLNEARKKIAKELATLSDLLKKRVKFDITLKVVNGSNSPYPVPFIAKNCPDIRPVETFELESVYGNDGHNYAHMFRMYLKTVTGERIKYFMNSGSIDIEGLNPRNMIQSKLRPNMQQQLFNAAHASKWAASWIERNKVFESDLQDKSAQMQLELDQSVLALNAAVNNVANRPTIAAFGASQAGKSYLISKMAAGDESILKTHWDDFEIDFIKHANPQGKDSEATGFATRFTHKVAQAPEGYPVELKIFHEMDLAMILVNSFFEEIGQNDVAFTQDEQAYINHLNSLQGYVDTKARTQYLAMDKQSLSALGDDNPANSLDFAHAFKAEKVQGRKITVGNTVEYNYIQVEEVTAFADYVASHSKAKIGSYNAMPKFWALLRDTLPFMTLEGRVQALKIFWKDLAAFNQLYRLLASELLKFKGYTKIFAAKEAFVSYNQNNGEHAQQLMQRAGGTIMHITQLGKMFNEQEQIPCALVSANLGFNGVYDIDEKINVGISILAALSLELCFVLENHGELDDFDILDLPGARTRKFHKFSDQAVGESESLVHDGDDDSTDFFRRGKVAYLFEYYSNNNAIDQLVFCVGVAKQQEVDEAFNILTTWVDRNIGADAKSRAAKDHSSLTIVLSRFDELLNNSCENLMNGMPIDLDAAKQNAFERLIKFNWFKEWIPGQPFNSIFLSRKPNLGKSIVPWLEFDDNKKEIGISSNMSGYIESSRRALLGEEIFNKYILNFEQALENVLTLNDGGVSKIVAAVKKNALSQADRESLQSVKPVKLMQHVMSELGPFATRDSAVALEKAKKASKELAYGLLQCNALSPCFDLLRSLLELPEDSLVDIYSQNFTTGSNAQRFVQFVCMEYQENLSTLWRKDNTYLSNIADNVVKAYRKQLPAFEVDPNQKNYFPLCFNDVENRFKTLDELKADIISLFNKLYIEVGKAFNSSVVNLKSYMVQVLLDQENTSEGFKDSVKSQVQLLSFILSDFNLYLGANLLPSNEDKKALEALKNSKLNEQSASVAPASAAAPAAPAINLISDSLDDLDDFDDDNDFTVRGATPKSAAAPAPAKKALNIPVGNINPSEFAMHVAQKGGVLGYEEGPVNSFVQKDNYVVMDANKSDHNVFRHEYAVDETGILPHLNETSRNFEFNLVSDYAATLMYMMCQVNVLSENRYKFTSDENLLLCRILSTMEAV